MSEQIANHSEETPVTAEQDQATEAIFEAFGMPRQPVEKKEIEFPTVTNQSETVNDQTETAPTTEPTAEAAPAESEKRGIKVKYNGEERVVDETEAPTLIQKGMNYDKVQQRLLEQQKALDEVAQLQGFKDHADLIANIPKLREQQQQKERDEFEKLKQDLRQEFEDNGMDADKAIAYVDNHPLVKKALAELEKSEQRNMQEQQERARQENIGRWNELYQAFPELVESSQAFNSGDRPEWYTAEMESMINRGYAPKDAYTLLNMDKIQTQSKKQMEQKVIKQQQLGNRAQVEGQAATEPDEISLLPAQLALAEMMGVNIEGVKRQQKIIQTRR